MCCSSAIFHSFSLCAPFCDWLGSGTIGVGSVFASQFESEKELPFRIAVRVVSNVGDTKLEI